MAKKDERSRLFFGMRNYKFETHDADGNVVGYQERLARTSKRAVRRYCRPYPTELTYIFHDKKDIDTGSGKKALHVFVARFAMYILYDRRSTIRVQAEETSERARS